MTSRAVRYRAAELPSGWWHESGASARGSACRTPATRRSRRRPAGLARDDVRLAVVTPAGTAHTTAAHAARPPPPGRPARRQHQRDAAVGGRPRAARLHLGDPRLDRARRRQLGGRAAAARQRRTRRRRRPARCSRLPGGVRLRIAEPHPAGPAPAVAGAAVAGRRPGRLPPRARPADPLPYVDGDWPSTALQNVYADPPRQRRDAQRRTAAHRADCWCG